MFVKGGALYWALGDDRYSDGHTPHAPSAGAAAMKKLRAVICPKPYLRSKINPNAADEAEAT